MILQLLTSLALNGNLAVLADGNGDAMSFDMSVGRLRANDNNSRIPKDASLLVGVWGQSPCMKAGGAGGLFAPLLGVQRAKPSG